MSDFRKALEYIDSSKSKSMYRGIDRKFFPKWEGWILVDLGEESKELDKYVEDFYYRFFWLKLKCNLISTQSISELLFVFAIRNGKKKAISKLQRVLGVPDSGLMDNLTINKLHNVEQDKVFLHFYAELVEFCICMGKTPVLNKLLNVYYGWDS